MLHGPLNVKKGLKGRIDVQTAENNTVGRDSGLRRNLREQTATRLASVHSCVCCCLQPVTLFLLAAVQSLCATDMIARVAVMANTPPARKRGHPELQSVFNVNDLW